MSTPMTEQRLAEIEEEIASAHLMVHALCLPRTNPARREWVMSIPARLDHDPDLVIGTGLMAADQLLAEVRRLRQTRLVIGTIAETRFDDVERADELIDAIHATARDALNGGQP